ncbi:MAG: hypothetical protein A07HR67_00044 [uncultured archaeon A07HR67]|nr:MAG: hypothetical protein A07HR67_00044 [uncultured archaeon A07HR67]
MPPERPARRTDREIAARGRDGVERAGEHGDPPTAAGLRSRGGSGRRPRRWARVLSAIAPWGVVAVAGVHLGAYGRRLAAAPPEHLAGLPIEADARLVSTAAALIADVSTAIGVLVGCATGWLVLVAAVRVAAATG